MPADHRHSPLALLTKEVYLSLFLWLRWVRALVASFTPWVAFDTLFTSMIDSVDFSILDVHDPAGHDRLCTRAGTAGTPAYGEWAAKKLKIKRATPRGDLAAGCADFCRRLLNCLDRRLRHVPVTDKYAKVSRAKLQPLYRRPRRPGLHHCADLVLGGSGQLLRPAGSLDVRFEIFVRTIPVQPVRDAALYMVFFTSLLGLRLRPDEKARAQRRPR